MRSLSFLLAFATLPFAGEMRPYLLANAGLTMPSIDIDGDLGDTKLEELKGYSATFGIGAKMAMNPQLDIDGSIGFSMVEGGVKLSYENEYTYQGTSFNDYRDGYTETTSSSSEFTLSPKLIDLEGGVVFHATPKVSIGGGIVFSIPVGGTYEGKSKYSSVTVCNDPTYTYCYEEDVSDSDKEDGDIDELFEDADTKPKSFMSFKIEGEYIMNDRLSLTAGWLLPMGDYVSEEGNTVSWSRAVIGIKYAFSIPQATASKSASVPSSAPSSEPATEPSSVPAAPAQP